MTTRHDHPAMTTAPSARTGPLLAVALAAAVWGLLWLPLRLIRESGLGPGFVTLGQFAVPVVLLLPLALWRWWRARPTGASRVVAGLLTGGAVALYSDSVLLTDVARALILFYVAPVWSTLLEITVMGRSLSAARVLSLVLGLAGLFVILGGAGGISRPPNAGDIMALMAGLIWALGTTRVRTAPDTGTFENVFAFFLYGSALALLVALLPVAALGAPPSAAQMTAALPWLTLTAAGFLIPVTWGLLWGSSVIDPGRLNIILQLEAVVGIGSAALLTSEPFGGVESTGALLVGAAGLVDVLGHRPPPPVTD